MKMSVLPDEIDRKILTELQRDASQSLDEIGAKWGLTIRRFGIEPWTY
jgi:DNA-binding Lrp family transcriptional regulator